MNFKNINVSTKSIRDSAFSNKAFVSIVLCTLLLTSFLIVKNRTESIPSTLFSGTTAFFSFLAYRFSKEKFRLDLFDKRWALYESTMNFCSSVVQQGVLRRNANNHLERDHASKSRIVIPKSLLI